jgi:beta-lactamase regulating signal transducer with metallopeptidase domain
MNPWMHVAGWTLIHFVWQGALLALAAAVALRLSRYRPPSVRYAIACVALAAMLVSPVITAHTLTAPSSVLSHAVTQTPTAPMASTRIGKIVLAQGGDVTDPGSARVDSVLPGLVWGWLTGVTLLLIRLGGAWWWVRRLRLASFTEPGSRWQAAVNQMASRLGLDVGIRVVDSALVDTPTLIGWLRPIILVPIAALTNLTPAQVDAILAHELAHVRRHDYAINLLQRLAEALLFYHPAVWWLSGRIRAEREQCCDEVAVRLCGDPAGYAAALAELESWRAGEAGMALAATDGALLRRLHLILRVPIADEARLPSWATTAALTIAFTAGAGGVQQVRSLVPTSDGHMHPAIEGRSSLPTPVAMLQPAIVPHMFAAQVPIPSSTGAWRVRATNHFDIYFGGDVEPQLERIERQVERAYQQVSSDLRHDLAHRPPIILFKTHRAMQDGRTAAVKAVETAFPDSRRDHVLVPLDDPSNELYGLLVHELTHLFEFDIIPETGGRRAPGWVLEGLADYERGTWSPRDLSDLRAAVTAGLVPKIAELDAGAGLTGRLPYSFGHAVFDFIEATRGKDGIRQLLLALRNRILGQNDNVYEAAFGITAKEFDEAFDEYLKDRLAPAGRPVAIVQPPPGDGGRR